MPLSVTISRTIQSVYPYTSLHHCGHFPWSAEDCSLGIRQFTAICLMNLQIVAGLQNWTPSRTSMAETTEIPFEKG